MSSLDGWEDVVGGDEHDSSARWAVLMVEKMVVVVMSMVVLQDEQSLLWRRWWWWWRSWWFCKMSSLDCGEGATAGEQMHLLQLSYWAQEVWQRVQVENHVSNHHQQPNFSNHHHQQPSNRLSGSNFFLPFWPLERKENDASGINRIPSEMEAELIFVRTVWQFHVLRTFFFFKLANVARYPFFGLIFCLKLLFDKKTSLDGGSTAK